MGSEILIIGATGTVGSEVASRVAQSGEHVRALVRSESSAGRLPKGVEAVMGDLRDEASLERAMAGARSVFYVAPHEPDEEVITDRVIAACESAQARMVFVGVHANGSNRFTRWAQRFVYGRLLAHYRPKFRLSERVRQSGCDPVILMPTNFFQNDELFRRDLEAGFFPQPFGKPVNRVDVRDLADAAARALTDFSIRSGAYSIVGPASLTGWDCARTWSAALGRTVVVEEIPERVDAAIARALQGKKREDFQKTYALLTRFAIATEARDLEQTEQLIGRAPTSHASYVRDVVQRWRSLGLPEIEGVGVATHVGGRLADRVASVDRVEVGLAQAH